MALELTVWQHRLLKPFVIASTPVFIFWFAYGSRGELDAIGIGVTTFFLALGAILVATSRVKEADDRGEAFPAGPVDEVEYALRANPLYHWLAGWATSAFLVGIVVVDDRDSPLAIETRLLVLAVHVVWATAVFGFFYFREERSRGGLAGQS
ncbi:hypothetical protein ACFL4Y_03575 [Gemmatimonadota bacterium]